MKHEKRGRPFWWRVLYTNDGYMNVDDDDDSSEVEIDDDDDDDDDDGDDGGDGGQGLEVDLDDDDDDDDDDGDDGLANKSKRNKKFASMRTENKALREENERIKKAAEQPSVPNPSPSPVHPREPQNNPNDPRNWTDDQWDEYAKKDWKGAVDLRSQINAERVVESRTKNQKDMDVMRESKKAVSAKHPELNESTSPKTKIYLEVLDENPRYLTDPKGPIHAMRDMEDRMRERGFPEEQIVAAEKRGANRERDRQSRVTLTSQKGRHVSDNGRKVQLTKDEVEFCKFNSIDTKEYAKNKLKMSKNKGRIQV